MDGQVPVVHADGMRAILERSCRVYLGERYSVARHGSDPPYRHGRGETGRVVAAAAATAVRGTSRCSVRARVT